MHFLITRKHNKITVNKIREIKLLILLKRSLSLKKTLTPSSQDRFYVIKADFN